VTSQIMCKNLAILSLTLYASIASISAPKIYAEPASSSVVTAMTRVYISTCSEHGSDGIYLADLNPVSGELRLVRLVASLKKASFLAIPRNHRYLYSTCEVDDSRALTPGAVSAFKIDESTGNLTPLNHQSSTANGPHYLSTDREGKHALVANYHGGGVAVLPIDADGKLGPATSTVLHHGSSVNKNRQSGPHPHAIDVDPTNRFVFVCDLGLDKVLAYRFDGEKGTLTADHPGDLTTSPGAGARHIAFHPNGKWAYVINELDSTLNVLGYDSAAGAFTKIETISTLPAGTIVENLTGEVVIHPNGKLLYASNRGHDSIAAFGIDESSGRLSIVDYYPAGGRTPRNFNIDPSGNFVLSANLDSDSVTVLRIDPATGKLSSMPHVLKVSQPYCIVFCPRD
jgi:6-phosphogluconolactonase